MMEGASGQFAPEFSELSVLELLEAGMVTVFR